MCIEAEKGELGSSPAERTQRVDPLNLIQIMLAEGQNVKNRITSQNKRFYKTSDIMVESSTSSNTKKIAVAAVLTGLTVALSTFYIPLGTTKCFPAQHMMNGIAGVLLGPWYAVLMATATGTIRNILGQSL